MTGKLDSLPFSLFHLPFLFLLPFLLLLSFPLHLFFCCLIVLLLCPVLLFFYSVGLQFAARKGGAHILHAHTHIEMRTDVNAARRTPA